MYDVVGVVLNNSNELSYFSPNDLKLKENDIVIVDTENGLQIGTVKKSIYQENKDNLILPLEKVIRIATKKDIIKNEKNDEDANEALSYVKEIVKDFDLEMSFVDAKYTFSRSQLYFYFVSSQRVDFRELAKNLAQKYKTRIELRQIGVRDKAKIIGGLGPCGLFLCCNTFLTDFNSVSINMAKNQFLALNPSKINGVCGRLLCCLNYEDDTYTELKKDLPSLGTIVETKDGVGKITSVDVFKRTVKVDYKNQGIIEYASDELSVKNK